jgi:Cu/Ag efflux pump CusA
MTPNLLSMGAVDFGIIVDGGVVIVEAIPRAHGAGAELRRRPWSR